jgi:hypothetical protein
MSGVTSRSVAQTILHHWRDNIYGFETSVLQWFNAQSFTTIADFGQLFDHDIDDIKYTDANGGTSDAPKSHKTRIKAAVGYYHFVMYYHNKDGTLDILTSIAAINKSTFGNFFMNDFNPAKDIVRYSRDYILELERAQIRLERDILDREKLQAELDRLSKFAPPEYMAGTFFPKMVSV